MSLNALKDAEDIHNAIHIIGTNDSTLINIIGRRPNWHLQKVREEYEKKYEHDLLNHVEHDCHFHYKKLITGLIRSRSETKAETVYNAVKGLGTNEHALIDTIIHSTDKEIEEFKQFFRQKYDHSLVDFVKSDTSFNFEKVLVKAIDAKRVDGVQQELIDSDVEHLYKAGEGRWGTDESTFIDVLTQRSFEHIVLVSKRYEEKHKHTLQHAITSESSGWFKVSLLACLTPPPIYWAHRINEAIKGLGTDDALLVRCFSECSKPLLQEVKREYTIIFNHGIEDDIKGDTSGHYKELLVVLLDLPESERKFY